MKKIFVLLLSLIVLNSTLPTYAQRCAKIDSLGRVLSLAQKLKTPDYKVIVDCYNQLAQEYKLTNTSAASQYAQAALELSESIQYQKGTADALYNIGLLSDKQIRSLDGVITKAKRALSLYKELENKQKVIELNEIIGSFYYKMGRQSPKNYQTSLTYFQEALEIRLEHGGDETELAKVYERIGEIYSYLQSDEKAIEYFKRAELINTQLGLEDINSTRLLAKYERIADLENEIQHTEVVNLIVLFSIVIFILVAVVLFLFIQKRDAYRKLKEHNLEGMEVSATSVN